MLYKARRWFATQPPTFRWALPFFAAFSLVAGFVVYGGGSPRAQPPPRIAHAPFTCEKGPLLGPWNSSSPNNLPPCLVPNPTTCEGVCLELLHKIKSERVRQAWPYYYADIADEVDRRGVSDGVFLEVGTAFGGLSRHLLQTFPRLRVVAVDPFFGSYDEKDLMSAYFVQLRAQYGQDQFSQLWAQAMAYEAGQDFGCRYSLINSVSEKAAALIPPGALDMVFVDGDHTRMGVEVDIATWQPKLKAGRSFLFNDYQHEPWPGVVQAVDAFAQRTGQPVKYIGDALWGNVALFNLPHMCTPP